MPWLYGRHHVKDDGTSEWYAGKTGQPTVHGRSDSGHHGPFAVGMYGEILAVHVEDGDTPTTTLHYQESEAIQAMIAIVGRENCGNVQQVNYPVTGWEWE